MPSYYSAPVAALTFDRGAFGAWDRHGRLVLEPEAFGIRAEFTPGTGKPDLQYDPFARRVKVTGTLGSKDELSAQCAGPLPRPDEAAASILGRPFSTEFRIALPSQKRPIM